VITALPNRSIEASKHRIIEIIAELESAFGRLPEKIIETKNLFKRQIENGRL
jgi:hypothetical protein